MLKMKKKTTPATTVERLPLYYRSLQKLRKEQVDVISSKNLGEMLDIPSTQVRKDLSYYGEFGRRGVGYEVEVLIIQLERILGIETQWEIVLVGVGNLGQALVNYKGFKKLGLNINYLFDKDSIEIAEKTDDIEFYNLDKLNEVIEQKEIKIGIIATPSSVAQKIANKLIDSGVEAIWNFAPTHLKVPENIYVRNEDLSIGLISLTYHLTN